MSRDASLICVVGALLAAVANGQPIALSPCDLTANQGRQEVDAQCGTLSVPIDRSDPDGETIDLFVAVVEALTEQPAPDPLVVIAGGPGEAATRFSVTAEAAFSRILRARDVVLVDQRGTGRSAPLDCGDAADGLGLSGALDPDALIDAGVACLGNLDHAPRFFTTSTAVADLEQVRIALGYDEVNLYGISYGTRVAQHYLRRFPARTRSVILDGVVPPGLALGPDVALRSQAALDALFERCEADANCNAEFPDLRRSFEIVIERLRNAPVDLSFEHPRTGETVDVVVDRMLVAGVVRLLVYSPQTASLLPVLIDAAHAGDYRGFATQALLVSEAMEELSVGLNYAVVCTEDMPYAHPLDLDEQAETYMGTAFVEITGLQCANTGRAASWTTTSGTRWRRHPGADPVRRTRSDHAARVRARGRIRACQCRGGRWPGPGSRDAVGRLRAETDGRVRGDRGPGFARSRLRGAHPAVSVVHVPHGPPAVIEVEDLTKRFGKVEALKACANGGQCRPRWCSDRSLGPFSSPC
ncbi:MAG: alpha/beta fold hydrolase [Gammaproteobacteria bacterium]|nr:alpha/beta fold hydrolase [Gammaproteobacteria bacterium]